MNIQFLKLLREFEARRVLPLFPARCRILEVGAGAGWQARVFAAAGHRVEAVDLPDSQYGAWRDFPVSAYDGVRLPFPDGEFDVVYSSSVLEHLPDVPGFDREVRRVLRPGGMAVHVLPRGRWCFWTLVTHWLKGLRHPGSLIRQPFPLRHGAAGSWRSEFVLFGKRRWLKTFRELGWETAGVYSNRLVYSGNSLLHERVSLRLRRVMALLFGGVCLIYVLRRGAAAPTP